MPRLHVSREGAVFFFTRSIRRKLFAGFAVIVAMLMAMAYVLLESHVFSSHFVDALDNSFNRAPQKKHLWEAVQTVDKVLHAPLPKGPGIDHAAFARVHYQQVDKSIRKSKEQVSQFLKQMAKAEVHPEQRPQYNFLASTLNSLYVQIGNSCELLIDPSDHDQAMYDISLKLSAMRNLIHEMKDPMDGFLPQIEVAHEELAAHSFWATLFLIAIVLTFLGLVSAAYSQLYLPINEIQKGARRVANGDMEYKIDVDSNDEMKELAKAFNRVTEMFNEINTNLDRKVEEKTRELRRSERLAGVGFLAAGVAHEINNPLSAISMAAESLSMRSYDLFSQCSQEDADDANEYLDMIQRESVRCQEITERLLSFARSQDQPKQPTCLNMIVNEVLQMLSHISKFKDRNIQFEPIEMADVEVNSSEIKQVVLNLAANALQAMKAGGTLQIKIEKWQHRAVVRFIDDGCGMSPEVLEHLFDPFYTNRADGSGTGLGLSITHRIVTEHHGNLEAFSEGEGKGSTFILTLPYKQPSQKAKSPRKPRLAA